MRHRLGEPAHRLAVALLCLLPVACRKRPPDVPPLFPPGTTTFTDQQLEQAVYCDYFVPPGFYREPLGEPRHHMYLTSASIDSARRHDRWDPYVSTDDFDMARTWADQSVRLWGWGPQLTPVGNDSTKIRIVSARRDERFFEFGAQIATMPPAVTHLRIHRASYFDGSHVDRSKRPAFIGTYRVRPVTAEGVKGLAEYLWSMWNDADNSPRALSSVGRATPDTLIHGIYAAGLDYGRNGRYHQITLERWFFRVSRESGDVLLRRENVRTIPGRIHDPDAAD